MLEIIVTGSEGQLGKEFQKLRQSNSEINFTFMSRAELDISKPNEVQQCLSQKNYDVLINCAAFTNVEQAEEENSQTVLINEKASGFLAEACRENEMLMVHISTDYVFNGDSEIPYTEEMETSPLNVYGKTKLEGERLIQRLAGPHLIIRTSWLYSTFGKNFFKTIVKAAGEKNELRIVNDQISAPTYAEHLALAIFEAIHVYSKNRNKFPSGVYHYSNAGLASWYDFAKEIVKQFDLKCNIVAVNSDEFYTKASRPSFSKLNSNKISNNFGLVIPQWEDGLRDCKNNWINE